MKRYETPLPYPFSRAVEANGFLFLSGQVSMNPDGTPLHGTVQEQTLTVLRNIDDTLQACGSSMAKVVKAAVWLSDMAHFQAFNEAYRSAFPEGFPARSTVTSQLAFGLDVEIEVMALV